MKLKTYKAKTKITKFTLNSTLNYNKETYLIYSNKSKQNKFIYKK